MRTRPISRKIINKVRAHFGFFSSVIVGTRMLVARTQEKPGSDSKPAIGSRTVLPPPATCGSVSLEQVLAARRSVRDFSSQPLTSQELSQLLWAAQGITSGDGRRTAPSSGGLYPLQIHLVVESGVFKYDPLRHEIILQSNEDMRTTFYWAAEFRYFIRSAPALFVITCEYEREVEKYGPARSPLYVHLEAGHVAQNLLLQAVSIGLSGVPVGGFYERPVSAVLRLSKVERPLYLVVIGHPAMELEHNHK